MSGPGNTKVFISYAHKDAANLARRLQKSLFAASFDAWLDERRLIAGAIWTTEIEREIDTSEVVLALVSPSSYDSEICRAEQLRSLRKGKRVIPLLAAAGSDLPLHLEAKQYRDFADENFYPAQFKLLLEDIRGNAGLALKDEYRTTRVTYVTAPPTVTNYIERPEELRALRDVLFADRHRQPLALTALAGMGGIGKTVLAHALTRDSVVQDAFPDGVVWITVGKEETSDLLARFREVGKALGDDLQRYETLPASINQYKTALAQKAALIVVDDIWKKSDLEPFLADSKRSRLLFTTRDASIAPFVGAREHRVELLDLEQARELLTAWAGLDGKPRPAQLDALVQECGNLPLALSQMGAMLKDALPAEWEDALCALRRADLTAITDRLPTGQESFFRTVEVSVKALPPEMQARYRALAVLLEDMAAPLPILETLWGVHDAEALRTSKHLVERSLAFRERDTGSIRLHDLQLDYVRVLHPDGKALDLLHAALRLSSHVIARDPTQFASQMAGRLLPYVQPISSVQHLMSSVVRRLIGWFPGTPDAQPPYRGALRLIHAALWLDALVAAQHPTHYASHMMGSLLAYVQQEEPIPSVQQFTSSVVKAAPRPWLRSLQPVLSPPGAGLVRTMAGHSDAVISVTLSEDGRRAVSASRDNTMKVWDLERGHELRTLPIELRGLGHMAVSADGQRAVSVSSWEHILKVWDLETGRQLRTLAGHSDWVLEVVVSADGRRAVSASRDKTLKVWDLETGLELRTLTGHSGMVGDVAVSADWRRAVSASRDKTLKVWDLETGRELRTLASGSGYDDAPTRVAISGDGRRAVSVTRRTLNAWNLETGQELRVEHGHLAHDPETELDVEDPGVCPFVIVSWDGRRAVSGAWNDRRLKVWDLETGRELRTFTGHSGVSNVALGRDGRWAVSAGRDKTLRVWDLGTGREPRTLPSHTGAVRSLAVSGNGRWAISASDWSLKVWDVKTGRVLRTLAEDSSLCKSMAISESGRRAVSPSSDNSILSYMFGRTHRRLKVWNVKTGRQLRSLAGHGYVDISTSNGAEYVVNGVAITRDGWRVVSASNDKTVKVWDVKTGCEMRTLAGHADSVDGVAVSGDGRRAVSASKDQTLKVWDLETGRELHTLIGHTREVKSVAMSGDGQRAVSAAYYDPMKVWDLETGVELHILAGHSDVVNCVAVSADGQRAVSASEDQTLKVWYLDTGELVATFTCDGPARCCAFAGQSRIIAGDLLGRVYFLSLELNEDR